MKQYLKRLLIRWRYRRKCVIGRNAIISSDSTFEGMNRIGNNTHFSGKLGYGSYISSHCDVIARIGRYTSVAPRVCTNPGKHPMHEPFVTTCPAFFSDRRQNSGTFVDKCYYDEIAYVQGTKDSVIVGNDCWIGEGAFIVGGVTISDGAVVLAHAVVTKDVPPYAIVAGVPARIIKYRYDEDIIKFLLEIKWWNFSHEWLKDNSRLLRNLKELKRYIQESANK